MYTDFVVRNVPVVLEAMGPQMEWNEAKNFPNADGNPYIGPDAAVNCVFAHFWTVLDGSVVSFQQYTDTEQLYKAMHAELGLT